MNTPLTQNQRLYLLLNWYCYFEPEHKYGLCNWLTKNGVGAGIYAVVNQLMAASGNYEGEYISEEDGCTPARRHFAGLWVRELNDLPEVQRMVSHENYLDVPACLLEVLRLYLKLHVEGNVGHDEGLCAWLVNVGLRWPAVVQRRMNGLDIDNSYVAREEGPCPMRVAFVKDWIAVLEQIEDYTPQYNEREAFNFPEPIEFDPDSDTLVTTDIDVRVEIDDRIADLESDESDCTITGEDLGELIFLRNLRCQIPRDVSYLYHEDHDFGQEVRDQAEGIYGRRLDLDTFPFNYIDWEAAASDYRDNMQSIQIGNTTFYYNE